MGFLNDNDDGFPFIASGPPRFFTIFSKVRRRASNSVSRGFFDFLGALPGLGYKHSIFALMQLEHGWCLLQRTFLRRQVTQLLGLSDASGGGAVVAAWRNAGDVESLADSFCWSCESLFVTTPASGEVSAVSEAYVLGASCCETGALSPTFLSHCFVVSGWAMLVR